MSNGSAKQGHNAVAQHLVHRALIAVHGVHHALQGWVEEPLGLFWVEVRISSVEPLRSANSTVTCLRSPSRALLDVRIFSARYGGV